MKYAILIYEPEEDFAARTGLDKDAYWNGYAAYHRAMVEAGAYAGGKALQPPQSGTTVRVRGGEQRVQDGPYADTKEQLGGFMLVEAENLDQALDWAARCPSARRGSAEVRPLMTLPGAGAADAARGPSPQVTHVALIYTDQTRETGMTVAQQEELLGAYFAYTRALREAGATAGGEPLEPTAAATTVRLRDGERLVQDGPFADTKEQLGGYYLLACESDAEAVAWAAKCPGAQSGAVEVRPVWFTEG